MNLSTMPRRNIFPFLLLPGTICAEFVCAQPDGDALLREADVTMGAARAHFRAVGREPADFQAFAHPHFGQ